MIEKTGIIHNMNKTFVFALAPTKFIFRLRAKKNNLKHVDIVYVDKYMVQYHRSNEIIVNEKAMEKVASDELFDYFEVILDLKMIAVRYYFRLEDQDETIFYGNYRFFKEPIQTIDLMFDCIIKVHEHEIFQIPSWANKAIFYQIFPDRFAKDDDNYDDFWHQSPLHDTFLRGGNLKGILKKLDYLQDLGITAIYLNPIFLSSSFHKYDTIDYLRVDPQFGDFETLHLLIEEAHKRNIKVLLDAVFNHTSLDFFAFKDLLINQERSQYKDWYYPLSFPLQIPQNYTQKPNYLSFAYVGSMPKLNTENEEVRNYVFKVVDFYMKEFKIDGWRLDVADEIPHEFWRLFRKHVKKINSEALIMGEVWYDASEWLTGDQFDTVMNYLLRSSLLEWLGKKTITATAFLNNLASLRGKLHPFAYNAMTNLIDSHDTERFLHTVNEDLNLFKIALTVQFTLNGMPMIYYGDEIGMSGENDPDCRRGMIWDLAKQNQTIKAFYKTLIALRKNHPALYNGEITMTFSSDSDNVCAYIKRNEFEELLILLNASDNDFYNENLSHGYDLINGVLFEGKIKAKNSLIIKIK